MNIKIAKIKFFNTMIGTREVAALILFAKMLSILYYFEVMNCISIIYNLLNNCLAINVKLSCYCRCFGSICTERTSLTVTMANCLVWLSW